MAATYGTYTSGSTNFTAASGVNYVIVKATGGGGGGGAATGTKSSGGGGAGGAYVLGTVRVTAGIGTYPVVVGIAGTAGTGGPGGVGGSSWFANTGSLVAPGGTGGLRAVANNTGSAGGAGGTTGAVGAVAYQGGNGATGIGGTGGTARGAGGGGGASNTGVGGNATVAAGGTAAGSFGGGGGAGAGTAGAAGTAGTAAGGGGGGGFSNNTTDRLGGAGAAGLVLLEYYPGVTGELVLSQFYPDANLSGYYRFEKDSYDEKGNYPGTDTGVTYTADGKYGGGVAFSADQISLGEHYDFNSGGFTFSTWIKTTTTTGVAYIVQKGAGTQWQYALRIEDGTAQWLLYQGSSGAAYAQAIQSTGSVSDGNWHHIAAVYNQSVPRAYVYVDGTLTGSSSSTSGTLGTVGTAFVYLGTNPGGTANFTGTLDDVAFFSRAIYEGEAKILAGSTNIRRNLVVNPSIEPDALYWAVVGGTKAQNSAQYYSRTKSLLFTGTGANEYTYWNFPDWGGSALIGSQYAYSCYLYGTGTVSLWMYDGATDRYSSAITLSTTWTKYEILGTAAGYGVIGGVRIQTANPVSCFIDANLLELASSTGAYFDGSAGGGVWEVGADTSSSYYITLPSSAAFSSWKMLSGVGG